MRQHNFLISSGVLLLLLCLINEHSSSSSSSSASNSERIARQVKVKETAKSPSPVTPKAPSPSVNTTKAEDDSSEAETPGEKFEEKLEEQWDKVKQFFKAGALSLAGNVKKLSVAGYKKVVYNNFTQNTAKTGASTSVGLYKGAINTYTNALYAYSNLTKTFDKLRGVQKEENNENETEDEENNNSQEVSAEEEEQEESSTQAATDQQGEEEEEQDQLSL